MEYLSKYGTVFVSKQITEVSELLFQIWLIYYANKSVRICRQAFIDFFPCNLKIRDIFLYSKPKEQL